MGITMNEIRRYSSIVGSSVECLPTVLVPYIQCMSKTGKNTVGDSVVECLSATGAVLIQFPANADLFSFIKN